MISTFKWYSHMHGVLVVYSGDHLSLTHSKVQSHAGKNVFFILSRFRYAQFPPSKAKIFMKNCILLWHWRYMATKIIHRHSTHRLVALSCSLVTSVSDYYHQYLHLCCLCYYTSCCNQFPNAVCLHLMYWKWWPLFEVVYLTRIKMATVDMNV